MELLESLYLGIIQGLTEFLPVSSSGHLELLSHILGVNGEENLTFAIAVHGGTVLSTIVVFRKEIVHLLKGFFKFKMNEETDFILKIVVSMIPVLILGLTLKEQIEELFGGSLLLVGCMLLVTATMLLFTYLSKPRQNPITYKSAFLIGVAQALAVLPGLSRSGSTISTGIMFGVKREEVSKFSFLMVLIPILGMNFLDIIKGDFSTASSLSFEAIAIGFVSAFVAGLFACKAMIKLVNKGKLVWFAVYCLVVGTATIIYSLG